MKNVNINRAWQDADYLESLSAEQRRQVPANPAGGIDLEDAALTAVTGGVVFVDIDTADTAWSHSCPCDPC